MSSNDDLACFSNAFALRRVEGQTLLTHPRSSPADVSAFVSLTTVITMWLYYSGQLPDFPFELRFWLMNLGTSVGVVVISRYAAIRSARAAVIQERAKRQLLADESR